MTCVPVPPGQIPESIQEKTCVIYKQNAGKKIRKPVINQKKSLGLLHNYMKVEPFSSFAHVMLEVRNISSALFMPESLRGQIHGS